ncbi:MAG: hypothetical protein AAB786_00490 [Patescibacteria group bacterium]
MNPGEAQPKSEFEQTMETCGYKLKETVKIADRNIVIYEKDFNPKFTQFTIPQSPVQILRYIEGLLEILNHQSVILIDGFDKDHESRKAFSERLETEAPDDYKVYYQLREKSKLRVNRLQSIFNYVGAIIEFTEDNQLKSEIKTLQEKLSIFIKSKNFHQLSLSEKVLYMEEVDKYVVSIIDLFRSVKI